MSDWLVFSQTVTATGHAHDFAVEGFQFTHKKMCFIAAERQGGGNDTTTPRRAIGIGTDHVRARRSLDETISAYDPSYRVIFSR